MRPLRLLWILSFLLVLAPGARADEAFPLEADARGLLPDQVVAVVGYRSLDAVEQRLGALLAAMEDEPFSALDLLPEEAQALADLLDRGRPVLVLFSLDMSYGSPEPILTVLLPLAEGGADPETLAVVSGYATAEVAGRWAALSEDPLYAPAGEVPALLSGLPDGLITASLDLETLFAVTRPLLEPMLDMMVAAAGDSAAQASLPPGTDPARSARALAAGVRTLSEASRRLDLRLDAPDGSVALEGRLGVFAGSALDFGPQPSLAEAFAAAGPLPGEPGLVYLSAVDGEAIYEQLSFLYEMQMEGIGAGLPVAQAEELRTWLREGQRLELVLDRTAAGGLDLTEEGLHLVHAARLVGAAAQAERMDAWLVRGNALDLGLAAEPGPWQEEGEARWRSYRWSWDGARFAEVFLQEGGGEDFDPAALGDLLEGLLPPLRLGVVGEQTLLLALERDEAAWRALLDRAAAGADAPPLALEALRSWAGEDANLALSVALRNFLRSAFAALGPLAGAEVPVVPAGEPVPIRASQTVGQIEHSFRVEAAADAFTRFLADLEAMKAEDGDGDGDGDDGD